MHDMPMYRWRHVFINLLALYMHDTPMYRWTHVFINLFVILQLLLVCIGL